MMVVVLSLNMDVLLMVDLKYMNSCVFEVKISRKRTNSIVHHWWLSMGLVLIWLIIRW